MPQIRKIADGHIVGDPDNGRIYWKAPSKEGKHEVLSTPLSRGRVYSIEQARAFVAQFPQYEILDPQGLYDHKARV